MNILHRPCALTGRDQFILQIRREADSTLSESDCLSLRINLDCINGGIDVFKLKLGRNYFEFSTHENR